ncbi:MAG: DegT/DnrJ/EryC1/StrS family aminotransferase [Candidatus Hydrogenedentes bacterium]|nr:DegT/DnrJ/EryC1/StrS family aminotransferase [Candidatus Hydrogenedentota bacterium]
MIPHSQPTVGQEELAAVARVLASGLLAQGREVAAFEEECAAFVGRQFGVAVNSGTAALHLSLLCGGLGPGKRVILPAYSCAALLQAVTWTSATPCLVDCGDDYTIDPSELPTGADAAIAVHLFGATSHIPEAPFVIEDLAQSIGGATGRAGHAAILSFYATKLLTTGEGGMVLTDDAGLAEEIRDRRDYDNRDDFKPRFAYKMTEMQAAMGRVQLQRLPAFLAERQRIAGEYSRALAGLPVKLPNLESRVCFRYVVATPEREALAAYLENEGVEAKRPIHRPLHHYTLDKCPKSEKAHMESLSLPVYPALSSHNLGFVIECVQRYFESVRQVPAI